MEFTLDYAAAIIIAAFGLLQAIIVSLLARENKKRKIDSDKVEKRALLRAKESKLAMHLMSANTGLAMATAKAVRDGQVNGEMEHALTDAKHAQREYYNFINETAATQFMD